MDEKFVSIAGIVTYRAAVLCFLQPTMVSDLESQCPILSQKPPQLGPENSEPHPRPPEKPERLSLSVLLKMEGGAIAFKGILQSG